MECPEEAEAQVAVLQAEVSVRIRGILRPDAAHPGIGRHPEVHPGAAGAHLQGAHPEVVSVRIRAVHPDETRDGLRHPGLLHLAAISARTDLPGRGDTVHRCRRWLRVRMAH